MTTIFSIARRDFIINRIIIPLIKISLISFDFTIKVDYKPPIKTD